MFEQEIIAALKKVVKGDIPLERPPDPKMGDFAFPCFLLAKEQKKSPGVIAEELAKQIPKPDCVHKIIHYGPYVNFFLDVKKVNQIILDKIREEQDEYGTSIAETREVFAIDFSHPNIGKPFHFGHLRSTIIGESISRLLEARGHKVERINYLGDWGTQFGALMYAYKTWGNHEEFKKRPIPYLVELYVKFNKEREADESLIEHAREWFAKLEKGDKEATEMWGEFRSHSLQEFQRIYDIFGSKFDSFNGEAYYARQVPEVIEMIKKKGITKMDEGALIVPLEGLEVPLMLLKSDGSSTYASRDIAAIIDRIHNMGATKLLYVVGHEQALHFKQVFYTMDLLGHPKENFAHLPFGLYLGPDGKRLATRKGKIILMDDVIKEATALALKTIHEKNPDLPNKDEVATQVAIGAIFFGDLLNDRVKDCVFDMNKILSFEGDTGPYVQYTHARACSILEKVGESKEYDASVLTQPIEAKLITLLMTFSDKIRDAASQYKPHVIAQYLIELGRAFNEFYHSCPVMKEEDEQVKHARTALVAATRQVLENGLRLLSIHAPREM